MKTVTGQINGKEVTFFVWVQCRMEDDIGPMSLVVTKALPIEFFPSTVEVKEFRDSELSESGLLSIGTSFRP